MQVNKRHPIMNVSIEMHTIPRLNLPEACMAQTHKQSLTNQGDYKKRASNQSMEHCGACKATRIKSFLISQALHREIRKHKERREFVCSRRLDFLPPMNHWPEGHKRD